MAIYNLTGNKVRVSDVIVPAIFNPYVIEQSTVKNALFDSGIVQAVPEVQQKMNNGASLVNMPFWKQLGGTDEVLSDTTALTPDKIGSDKDVATQLFRGKSWAENDLSAIMAGSDPMMAIGDMVAVFWKTAMQSTLTSVLNGVFTGPLATSHVNNLSIEDGNAATDSNKIGSHQIVDTVSKLGDKHDSLTAMVMHSVPYFNLVKQQLITFIPDMDGKLTIPTYMGKRVIVDDGSLTVAGSTSGNKYYTFLFSPGAIGYAEGTPEVPTETDRDILGGDDILVNRKHYVLHPRGVKWLGTSQAGVTPTNAELANTTNWSKVYQDKNIRMVALITNG